MNFRNINHAIMPQINSPMSEETKWSFTVTEKKGDVETTTRVRQVENGFITCKEKSWKENGEYKWETKEYISKDNPIPSLTKKEETSEQVRGLEGFFNSIGDGLIDV